ncbi:phosphotransferase [Streptomyces parvus]|uniref:phosphotransferase n=1 Tax=Streptomyces parvus TaxID=66428 RepID=UPI0033F0873C
MNREPEGHRQAESDRERAAHSEPEVLSGGLANAGAVLRHGDTVERPAPPHVTLLHAHLRALREQGFDGVPVPLGVSESGHREQLSYVPGEVAVTPYPDRTWTDDALRSVGALLRRMHGAAAGVPFDPAAGWPADLADPEGATAPGAVVCHNDACLENVVFQEGRAAALIDFDLAAPGRPVWDVAMAARYWVPMRGRPGLDPAHRLRVLAGGYGLGRADRAALPRVIEQATAVCRAFVERRVARGDAAYTAAYERSGRTVWDRHQEWLADHRPALTAALLAD